VLKTLFSQLGRPRAGIFTVTNPKTGGFFDLLDQCCAILARYGQLARVVVFVIDTDCDDGRPGSINKPLRLRNALANCAYAEKAVIVAAVQEIEVWALWGSANSLGDPWASVRDHCHPKERYFEPLTTVADKRTPDGGRSRLIQSSLARTWPSLTGGCPELAQLQMDIEPLIA
jgi:hypothetical protein